jgi:hypothetical protein
MYILDGAGTQYPTVFAISKEKEHVLLVRRHPSLAVCTQVDHDLSSILTSLWGAIIFTMASIIQHYAPDNYILATCFLNVGWVAMVTGFSFVLYSRLHLLQPSKLLLKIVLYCIIIDAWLFHAPVFIATIYGNVEVAKASVKVFTVLSSMEIAFSVQETVLASLYIYLFLKFTADSRHEPETKRTLYLLIAAEIMVLSTDIVLNVLLYTKIYLPRAMLQSFMSMLKLKIEFIVLNALIKFANAKSNRGLPDVWLEPMQSPISPSDKLPTL